MGIITRPSPAADGGKSRSRSSPTASLPIQIEPGDVLAVELHTRADRRRIHRSARATAASILESDRALSRMTGIIRGTKLEPWRQKRISTEIRTALRAHQAALLQAAEIESISRRMEVAR